MRWNFFIPQEVDDIGITFPGFLLFSLLMGALALHFAPLLPQGKKELKLIKIIMVNKLKTTYELKVCLVQLHKIDIG